MIYTIKKNAHYASGFNFGIHKNGMQMSKTIIFNDSCIYNLNNNNQLDINKLFGFSVGLFSSNHENSARFGWRWNVETKKIELLAYVYVSGERVNEWDMNILILSISINSQTFCTISIDGPQYKFEAINSEIGGNFILMPRAGNGMGYNQYPYFGGSEVAPHDICINIS